MGSYGGGVRILGSDGGIGSWRRGEGGLIPGLAGEHVWAHIVVIVIVMVTVIGHT